MFPEGHFCKAEYSQLDDFYLDYNTSTSNNYTLLFDVNTVVCLDDKELENNMSHFRINPMDTSDVSR